MGRAIRVFVLLGAGTLVAIPQTCQAQSEEDYFRLFRAVVEESRGAAPGVFKDDKSKAERFEGFAKAMEAALDQEVPPAFEYLKRVKPADGRKDEAFVAATKNFGFGLVSLQKASGSRFKELVPSYDAWNSLETDLDLERLRQRLAAYEIRYGPGSERLNILEYLGVQIPPFRGDSNGPKAWEPIARLTPISLTSGASGPVSTVQAGLNYYFIKGAPKWLGRFGIENHIGVAGALQYLEREKPMHFQGRPTFGVVVHMDRKEVGFTWTEAKKQAQVTFGYAFQFVPLGL